jgi:hypothetical protein
MIPKILIQSTNRKPTPQRIKDKFNLYTGNNWEYRYFSDKDIIKYFEDNALDEFPSIIEIFYKLKGPHKADLFRYYFLYKNGGVWIDADAMIYQDINYLVENYAFFTAVSEPSDPIRCFNGFIGSEPNNEIIRNAIYDCVNVDIEQLDNEYFLLCNNLFTIVNNSQEKNIKLLIATSDFTTGLGKVYDTDDLNNPVLIHYFRDKIIPGATWLY